MAKMTKKAAEALDNEISLIYKKQFENHQINVWGIPKIFSAARQARETGHDMTAAIIEAGNKFCKTKTD